MPDKLKKCNRCHKEVDHLYSNTWLGTNNEVLLCEECRNKWHKIVDKNHVLQRKNEIGERLFKEFMNRTTFVFR
jgi:hypothetical protein